MSEYCTECGTQLIDGICPKCTSEQKVDNKYNKIFMDPKEKFITVLGSDYAQNFLLRGSINRGFAVVSDKRAYFRGTIYEINNLNGKKKYSKSQRSRVVDLNDITGTGYETMEDEVYKWARFAILIPAVVAIIIMLIAS